MLELEKMAKFCAVLHRCGFSLQHVSFTWRSRGKCLEKLSTSTMDVIHFPCMGTMFIGRFLMISTTTLILQMEEQNLGLTLQIRV